MSKGGGGGSSSGEVDYPGYMKTVHETWLDEIVFRVGTAQGQNPYSGLLAYDPTTELSTMSSALTTYEQKIATSHTGEWDGVHLLVGAALTDVESYTFVDFLTSIETGILSTLDTDLFSDDNIENRVDAFSDILDSEITNKVLPRYSRGQQNVNAVASSSYSIGAAMIEADRTREVAKFSADMYYQNEQKKLDLEGLKNEFDKTKLLYQQTVISFDELKMKWEELQSSFVLKYHAIVNEQEANVLQGTRDELEVYNRYRESYKALAHYRIELERMHMVATHQENVQNATYGDASGKWALEQYTNAGNLLGSIAGSAVSAPAKNNNIGNALGGALSGAAAGAMIGSAVPGIGTGIGAGVGALAGLAGGLF